MDIQPPKLHWWQVALVPITYPFYACMAAGIALWSVWEILNLKLKRIREEEQVHRKPKYDLGTRLQKDRVPYRYACAGEDLRKGTIVEAGLSGRLVIGQPLPEGKDLNKLIYGDVRPAYQVDKYGSRVLGWPIVNVKKGRHFWLQEPPLRAEFKKEDRE